MKVYLSIIGAGILGIILVWTLFSDALLNLFLTVVILGATVIVPTLFMFVGFLGKYSMGKR
ncbi:hypothetical protein GCM10009720_21250 [Yaniella flava]|uniref:NADH dehydrogenase subunit 6 n=1 Tax=Yaniella flava TaxID=287930 RepID=A0ABP5G7V1_9MICC